MPQERPEFTPQTNIKDIMEYFMSITDEAEAHGFFDAALAWGLAQIDPNETVDSDEAVARLKRNIIKWSGYHTPDVRKRMTAFYEAYHPKLEEEPMKRHGIPSANQYTLEEKLKCVAILKDMGGLTKEAILACQNLIPVVPKDTLARWLREYGPRVAHAATEIVEAEPDVQLAKMTTVQKMLTGYNNLLDKLADPNFVKNSTNLLHVATSFGILEERIRLAMGLSAETVNVVKRFIAVLGRKGFDPMQVFEDLIEEYEKEPDVRASTVIDIAAQVTQSQASVQRGRRRRP